MRQTMNTKEPAGKRIGQDFKERLPSERKPFAMACDVAM